MNPPNLQQLSQDYQRVEEAIRFIEDNTHAQPTLEEIAAHLHLSEFHFQRLFTRWAGISPKRFLQFLTRQHAKRLLDQSSVLDAALEAGLTSPGRLHDLFVNTEAVTPGEYKTRGAGIDIHYGFHPTPFGECLLAVTPRGICFLAFVNDGRRDTAMAQLQAEWANAELREAPEVTRPYIEQIFMPVRATPQTPLRLHLRGTNFQIKVWEALLRIPPGETTCYEDLAAQIGQPGSARAVGSAVASNPVAYLIPCHRVLRKVGDFGNYRYGPARKKAMLLRENP